MSAPKEHRPASSEPNEGEGNRTAARRYEAGVRRTLKWGHVDEAAHRAAKALDGPEGKELREAEAKAKRHQPGAESRAATRPKKH